MKKWEYKKIAYKDADLDALGNDGWELVCVHDTGGLPGCNTMIFKRPLPEPITMATIGPPALPF